MYNDTYNITKKRLKKISFYFYNSSYRWFWLDFKRASFLRWGSITITVQIAEVEVMKMLLLHFLCYHMEIYKNSSQEIKIFTLLLLQNLLARGLLFTSLGKYLRCNLKISNGQHRLKQWSFLRPEVQMLTQDIEMPDFH